MSVIEEIKSKFSIQDCGTHIACGAIGGAITSRFFEAISLQKSFVSGALIGLASYSGELIPEKYATPMHIVLVTIISVAILTFALLKTCTILPASFPAQILLYDEKILVTFATFNVFGKALSIYFPEIFSRFRAVPILPLSIKETFELPAKEIKACHTYYKAHPAAYTTLPIKTQFVLNQAFKKENLTPLIVQPLQPTTFDDWDAIDLSYVCEQNWSLEKPALEAAFQKKCYDLGLEPPKKISENFALPADISTIMDLNKTQKIWFKLLFESYPIKWDQLPLNKKLAFRTFDEFNTFNISPPKTKSDVIELSPEGLNFFYMNFDLAAYDPEVGLALIERFAEGNFKLPEGIQKYLEQLPQIITPTDINHLQPWELKLYALLFQQDPKTYWEPLPENIQWAFRAKNTENWPAVHYPTTRLDILNLDKARLTYFYQIFKYDPSLDPTLHYTWFTKFYESELPPTPEMVASCIDCLRKNKESSPFEKFSNPGQIERLSIEKLQWLSTIYQNYKEAWIALPLNYQVQFRKRIDARLRFPTLTYPTSKTTVETLDAEATTALQSSFDISIMLSKRQWSLFSLFKTSPLEDQDPKLFSLSDSQRREVLIELGKKFTPPLPKGFENYIDPPGNFSDIQKLDKEKLLYWGQFFKTVTKKWEALNLFLQIEFRIQAQKQHVPLTYFPEIFVKDRELKTLAIEGNNKRVTGTANNANFQYIALIHLYQHTTIFELENWVQWTYATQIALKTAFEHLAIDHNLPGTGNPIPPNPQDAIGVKGLDAELIKVYHANFYPQAFEGINCDTILEAFVQQFTNDLGGEIGTLGLNIHLLKNINLSQLSDADKMWAQRVLTDGGEATWERLPCSIQLVYRRECAAMQGGIPISYLYNEPTIEEIRTFSTLDLKTLYAYYNKSPHWVKLPYPIQAALNKRFQEKEVGEEVLVTPWDMSEDYANTLPIQSPEALAFADYYNHHVELFYTLDTKIQTILNNKFGTNQIPLDVTFNKAKYWKYWLTEKVAKHYIGHQLLFYVPNIKNRIASSLTRRNIAIATVASTVCIAEETGLTNFVPDIVSKIAYYITSAVVKGAFNLTWSLVAGTGSLLITSLIPGSASTETTQ